MQYQYIDKTGKPQTIEANSPEQALQLAGPNADPHSGVQALGQGATPAPTTSSPSLPPISSAGPSGSTGSVVDFKNALDYAHNLAKQKRNALGVNIMNVAPTGVLRASDFNSILGNLNKASDTYSTDVQNNILEQATPPKPDLRTVSGVGVVSIKPDGSYDVIVPEVKSGGSSGGGANYGGIQVSGNLTYNPADIQQGNQALKTSSTQGTEADGKYADPTLYLNMYKRWTDSGGKATDFFKEYPYELWINPSNTWLRQAITDYNNKGKSSSTNNQDLVNSIDQAF